MSIPAELAQDRSTPFRQKALDYLDLIKPRILLLVLLTVYGTMAVAAGGSWPALGMAWPTLIGVALAVGAGGALNCFIERDRDARMARTAHRPLASGRMKPVEALALGTLFWICSYFLLYFLVNPLTAYLTMLAFGAYVGIYTPLKSRSPLCTLIGAVPGALPPVIGWAAIRAEVDGLAFVLFSIQFLWQIPHFLALALARRCEYEEAGLPMYPVVEGSGKTLDLILLYTAALVPVSLLPYGVLGAGPVYLCIALSTGAIFLGLALQGHQIGGEEQWCRRFFLYSIVYLVVLFGALVSGF
ncbi:MAG: protoheme IX farnesyltransferase [Candidatus Lindowbacteria bacterium RIFCSPLOWO2_12_FULL_62_27]|nr:MAG: protoheme IX farnesyltransferase [Candidatus Lindowbacteria bacterium RIFCSPLOWO2_12_FULL_62_27]OGH61549.1 MAG: protoheme IX farnesyltransferase [Candidatus Lindowbacteria bacterium RIFCSPLOWO2_02_FULL_62_12]